MPVEPLFTRGFRLNRIDSDRMPPRPSGTEVVAAPFVAAPVAIPLAPPSPPAFNTLSVQLSRSLLEPVLMSVTARNVELRGRIESLGADIRALEHSASSKEREIQETINQIEARKNEIRRERDNRNTFLLLGALGGLFAARAAGAAGLVTAIQDDRRIRELEGTLAQRRNDLANVQSRIAQYRGTKTSLEVQLIALQNAEREMSRALPDTATLDGLADRLVVEREIVENLRSQVVILGTIRDHAAAININLDALVAQARGDLARAEQLLEESRKSTFDVLRAAAGVNPTDALLSFANRQAERMVRQVVEVAVGRALAGADQQVRRRIVDTLMRELRGS